MATYCIGRRYPHIVKDVKLFSIPMIYWDLKRDGVKNSDIFANVLLPNIEKNIGPICRYNECFNEEIVLAKTGITFVGAQMKYKQLYTDILAHCKKFPNSTVIILGRTSFNVQYMIDLLPHIRKIMLIKPLLALGGYRASYMGSALLMFGKSLNINEGIRLKKTYFACWKQGQPIQ